MNAITIEHVDVAELPAAWRKKLRAPKNARITVRLEPEPANADPAFGMWKDREDMADVAAYVRKMRAGRPLPR